MNNQSEDEADTNSEMNESEDEEHYSVFSSSSASLHTIDSDDWDQIQSVFNYSDGALSNKLFVSASKNVLEGIQDWINEGHSLNINDNRGWTVLHYCVMHKSYEALQFILKQEVRIDALNFEGETPLLMAIRLEDPQALQALLCGGAQMLIKNEECSKIIDSYEYLVNSVHTLHGRRKVIDVLVQFFGCLPTILLKHVVSLTYFSQDDLEFVYALLIDYKVSVNTYDANECPVHTALEMKRFSLVKVFLDFVDDWNYVTELRETSLLKVAIMQGYSPIEDILERGGDLILNNEKETLLRQSLVQGDPTYFCYIWDNINVEIALEYDSAFCMHFIQNNAFTIDNFVILLIAVLQTDFRLQIVKGNLHMNLLLFFQNHDIPLESQVNIINAVLSICPIVRLMCFDFIYAEYGFNELVELYLKHEVYIITSGSFFRPCKNTTLLLYPHLMKPEIASDSLFGMCLKTVKKSLMTPLKIDDYKYQYFRHYKQVMSMHLPIKIQHLILNIL